MVKTLLVSESRLDRGKFLLAARQITGENHAKKIDSAPGRSPQDDDITILDDFASKTIGHSVIYLGFLFASRTEEIDDILQRTGGMPHVKAGIDNPLAKAIMVTGSVLHWSWAVRANCTPETPSHVRRAFTDVYHAICQLGLQRVFDGCRRRDHADGTILLIGSK